MTVIGTGYLGATHAICMAVLGYDVLGVDIDRGQDRGAPASARCRSSSPACPRCSARPWTPAGCGSPPTSPRPASSATSTSSAWARRSARTRTPPTSATSRASVRDLAPHLRRTCLVVGKSTVPVGTAAAAHRDGPRTNAPAGPTSSSPGTPSSCARASPSRTPCSPDRLVFGVSSRAWARSQLEAAFAPLLEAGAPVVVAPTWRPPSWSRSPRTRSWPPRSPTSTPWPRCARRPAPTCKMLAEALSYDDRIGGRFLKPGPRLRRRLPAQGHPRLHPPRRGARRRQVGRVPAPGRRDQPAASRSAPSTSSASRPAAILDGRHGLRARRGVQAQLRRHPRRAGPGRGPDAAPGGRRGAGLRPRGDGQRPPGLPRPALRATA